MRIEEGETRGNERGGFYKMAVIVIWILGAVSILQACSVSSALANPIPIQVEDESLLGLLMQYSQVVVELGEEHPTRVSLRSRIDEKLKAGERLDQEKMVATLNELRTQYRTARAKLVESHPSLAKLTANIATLVELLASDPENLVTNLDAVMRAKDDWGSGILYVPGGGLTGYVHRIKPNTTEITILKGANNGLKVGMHLHLYVRQGALERWRPDGKNYIMGRVESVEPYQAQVKLLAGIPDNQLPTSIFYMQPGFNVGSLILTIRFDETAWKNRPLMNAFLGELRIACSEGELVKPKILVTDTPRTDCVIDVLPIGPSGHSEDQLRTLNELAKFVAEQPYFPKVKLNSVTTSPKASSTADEEAKTPKSDRNSLKTLNDADKWEVFRMANLKQALKEWQNNKLHGRPADAMPDLLSHLRTKSEEAEKASIAKASEVRNAVAAKPSLPSEAIDKLKAELRDAVDEAFDARQRLHLMEVTSLTIKMQTMLSNLSDRLDSRTEIVDRRIDDLLNPNNRWEASLTQESSVEELAKSPLPNDVEAGATSLASVEGLMTFRGKPITGTVWFNCPRSLPRAAGTNENGKFKLDSLMPGKYTLTIDADSGDAAKEIPAKYKSSETTPIEFEVLEGKNVFDIELTNPFTTTTDR